MYNTRYYRSPIDKWYKQSADFQILNIATELKRANNWINRNREDLANSCYERAFELIDMTASDPKWSSNKRELLRCREILGEIYISTVKNADLNKKLYRNLLLLNSDAYNAVRERI